MLFQNSEKIYVSYYFLILVKDSYSLTKFEWEICPKSQFLMQQELNTTPKPTKNKNKEALKATQAKEAKKAKMDERAR